MSQQPEQWAQEALRFLGEAERWVRRMSAGGREEVSEPATEPEPVSEPVSSPAEAPVEEQVVEPMGQEEDPWREATDHVPFGNAPECEFCPMCRTIRAVRTFRPDLATQLIKVLDQVNREGRRIWR
jgi:hypothetical protein